MLNEPRKTKAVHLLNLAQLLDNEEYKRTVSRHDVVDLARLLEARVHHLSLLTFPGYLFVENVRLEQHLNSLLVV